MIKIILPFIALVLTACATKSKSIPEVDPVRNVTIEAEATEIYQLSRQWIVENFRSTKSVIALEDKSINRLVANGSFEDHCMLYGASTTTKKTCEKFNKPMKPLDFVIQIDASDGGMRYEVTAVTFDGEEVAYKVLQHARYDALEFAIDIKEYVRNNM